MSLLQKAPMRNIPENAVILSETEALNFQMNVVRTWEKRSEVFVLRYGGYTLGLSTLLSSVFLNNHFRRKFMLGHYGAFSTYIPVCILPAAVSLIMHVETVLRKVLLMDASQCPVCLQVKSAALQTTFGAIYPLLAAPIGGATLAVRYGTYNIPLIHEKPKEVLGIFNKMMTKIKTKTMYIFLWQALLGAAVTYFETSEIIGMHEKLATNAANQE